MGNKFVGKYVDEIKDLLVASLVAGENAVLVGPPGTGKTRIALDVACHVYDREEVLFLQLDASTPPEAVKGLPDPAELLNTPPRIVINLEGSVFDPNVRVVILDEFGRPNDTVFDVLVHGLNRSLEEGDLAPVFWGTTNFVHIGARTEAMADRVLLWYWVDTGKIKTKDVVMAALGVLGNVHNALTVGDHLPTPEEIAAVRAMIPGKNASKAVVETIDSLVEEIQKNNNKSFVPNNRRLTQWAGLLFRVGAYYAQDDDFSVLPEQALKILKYAQVNITQADFAAWGKLVNAISDVVGTAIRRASEAAFETMKRVSSNSSGDKRAQDLGMVLAQSEEDLDAIEANGDPRVEEYQTRIRNAYAQFVQGKTPSGL